jgi:enterochelin esterase family protein
MKLRLITLLSASMAACVVALAQSGSGAGGMHSSFLPLQAPDPDAFYALGPDSLPRDGVPKGETRARSRSRARHIRYTAHVLGLRPAQYDPAIPARIRIYNEVHAFMNPD